MLTTLTLLLGGKRMPDYSHNSTALFFVQSSGDKALYVWRPVPPSSVFVALGMIATTTEAPPPQDSVRCVPRRWVVESTFKPVKVGLFFFA